jgi:hypothetical protein
MPLHPGAARYFKEAGLSLPDQLLADQTTGLPTARQRTGRRLKSARPGDSGRADRGCSRGRSALRFLR